MKHLNSMETLYSVRRTLTLAGHRPDGSVAFRTYLFTTFLLSYAIDLVYSMFLKTDDIKKILALKELNSIVLALVVIPGSTAVYELCNVIENQMKRKVLQPLVPEVVQIRIQLDLEHNETGRKIYRTLVLIIIVYVSVPVLQSITVLAFNNIPMLSTLQVLVNANDNLTAKRTLNVEEDLPLVFYFYYPHGLATIWFYFLLSLTHAIWCIWICLFLYSIFNSALMSIKNMMSDMKALGVALGRIDGMTSYIQGQNFSERINSAGLVDETKPTSQPLNEKILKDYLRLIVTQHQSVCRDLKTVDKGLKSVIVALDVVFGIHMCLAIYCIVKMEAFSLKIEYTILLFWLMTVLYNYSAIGQQITNEGEDLMMKMYDCAWVDKPKWFKTSLLLVLTRSARRMQLKPYGLYELNLTSFKNVMNAAYSLFNVLKKIA